MRSDINDYPPTRAEYKIIYSPTASDFDARVNELIKEDSGWTHVSSMQIIRFDNGPKFYQQFTRVINLNK